MIFSRILKRAVTAIAVLWIGMIFQGCSTPNPSLGVMITNPDGTEKLEPRVVINDSRFRRRIAIDAIESRDRNGLLQVEVRTRNLSSRGLSFVYRFTWTGEKGYAVDSPAGGWETAWFEGYQSNALKGVAPSVRAIQFKLEIQPRQ